MRLFPYIFLAVCLISCSSKKEKEGIKYFEGIVEFKVDISANNALLQKVVRSEYGERIISYINKKGFVSREYIDTNNIIVKREIFNPDSLRFYTYKNGNDTILYEDVSKETSYKNISVEWGDTISILNKTIIGVKSTNKYYDKRLDKTFDFLATYYNLKGYPISPKVYTNISTHGLEKIFSKAPYLTVGMILQLGNFARLEVLATRILEEDIEDFHFELPKNKILIEG